ncbi:hypothetical protein BKA56DRAFT_489247, partial [Ilyonectria sp. MPI-CAGE-AT-0026]
GTENCRYNPNGSVTSNIFQLYGVGNINTKTALTSTYSATMQYRNKSSQIIYVKISPSRNGCLAVLEESASPVPTETQFKNQATCPNPNWTKELLRDTIFDES